MVKIAEKMTLQNIIAILVGLTVLVPASCSAYNWTVVRLSNFLVQHSHIVRGMEEDVIEIKAEMDTVLMLLKEEE